MQLYLEQTFETYAVTNKIQGDGVFFVFVWVL